MTVSLTLSQSSIRALSTDALISSRIASTDHVRVEFLRCGSDATLEWSVPRPEVSLMWVRDKGSNARITLAGRQPDIVAPGRANFWFFPEGVDAQGELTGKGAYDCAGVFVDPQFLLRLHQHDVIAAGGERHALSRPDRDVAERLHVFHAVAARALVQ